jgi:hypothetical protein
MGIDSNIVIYKISNENLSYAAGRLLSCREAQIPGFCEMLRFNQRNFLRHPKTIKFIELMRATYECYFDDYQGRDQEMLDHVTDKNPKKKLRIAVCASMEDEGTRHDRVLSKRIVAKGKNEIAKINKWMRLYTSFGPESALQAGWLMAVMKGAQASAPIFVNGGCIEFVKSPSLSSMKHTFGDHSTKWSLSCSSV